MPTADDLPTCPRLLRRLAGPRDEEAWRTFLERYLPLIEGWCRRWLCHHDAENLAGSVLEKLVRALPRYAYDRRRGRFRAWLYVIIRREAHGFWKALRCHPEVGIGGPGVVELLPDPFSLEELADELDERLRTRLDQAEQIVERVQGRVDPRTWEIYWRVDCLGQPAGEVIAALRVNPNIVRQARYRVRKLLREEGSRFLETAALTSP